MYVMHVIRKYGKNANCWSEGRGLEMEVKKWMVWGGRRCPCPPPRVENGMELDGLDLDDRQDCQDMGT